MSLSAGNNHGDFRAQSMWCIRRNRGTCGCPITAGDRSGPFDASDNFGLRLPVTAFFWIFPGVPDLYFQLFGELGTWRHITTIVVKIRISISKK
jgi:hypothetical protein